MDSNRSVETPERLSSDDVFKEVADKHRQDVGRIRERSRMRRLRWLSIFGLIVFALLARRVLQGQPYIIGFPQISSELWPYAIPLLLILVLIFAMILPQLNGRSPHVRYSPEQVGIGFHDVKGIDVVLEEVTRTLQIFLTYKKFREELGGNPRRGILFEGKPGTGKTHLAKAMAAEAGVPFFYVAATSLQSMYYGSSARRIRSFFKTIKTAARKEGGAIGFIEEIDAIGGARGGVSASPLGAGSFGSLRMTVNGTEGIVNELLVQLQSFDEPDRWARLRGKVFDFLNLFLPSTRRLKSRRPEYSNILIIGATNRASALDPALMRPGRFDRSLYFDLPSRVGRRELIDYFLSKRSHAEEIDREDLRGELASMTIGYSPAMLEHVLDEALVWAMRDGRDELNWRDVQQARLSEEIGLAQPVAYTDHERDIIATHEAGHAVIAYLAATTRKLEVLSIIKRREALGLLAHSDTEERFTRTKSELEATLKVAFGGMAAEQIFFGESGTGPLSDLQAATTLAAQMIGSFGMGSSLVSYEAVENGGHSSPNIVAKILSNEDSHREVEEILRRHKDQVTYLLSANRDLVEALRDALLEREELMGDEIMAVIEEALGHRRVQL